MMCTQALKPRWPKDDCYHSCCNGETAPSAPAVPAVPSGLSGASGPSGRKEAAGAPKKAASAKAADKVSTHW